MRTREILPRQSTFTNKQSKPVRSWNKHTTVLPRLIAASEKSRKRRPNYNLTSSCRGKQPRETNGSGATSSSLFTPCRPQLQTHSLGRDMRALLGVNHTPKSDGSGSVVAGRHQQVLLVLIEPVGLREIPD